MIELHLDNRRPHARNFLDVIAAEIVGLAGDCRHRARYGACSPRGNDKGVDGRREAIHRVVRIALKSYQIDGKLLRTGAANFSASGLKRQDNDLIVIESAGAAASFKRNFDARFASGEDLAAGAKR